MKHITPSEEIFNEMINIATIIWKQYDDEFGYVTEKLNIINNLENYEDNVMVAYRMFDHINQSEFRARASKDVLEYIKSNL
jgi:uncharacterized iron-regulated protein